MIKIAVIGATLTGNKGAASMLIALVQNFKNICPADYIIDCLTIYGKEDEKFNFYKNLTIIKCTPFDIICIVTPLSIIYRFLGWVFPVKKILLKNRVLRTIYSSDLIVNMAGISYSDGRGLILLYNIACDLTPLMLKKRVFKYSQAIGPFKTFLNRFSAKMILPKITKIAGRGELTIKNLQELGLNNYEYCPDAAFLMSIDMSNVTDEMAGICGSIRRYEQIKLGIAPSSVVEQYSSNHNLSYIDLLAKFIDGVSGTDKYKIILFPYCALSRRSVKKNNDLGIVDSIFKKIRDRDSVIFLDKEYSAEDLRYLISCLDILITSRYHGMVMALSVGVIPLVIGWSHKYSETLRQFLLDDLCIDYSKQSIDLLENKLADIIRHKERYKERISSELFKVKRGSFRNFSIIKELMENAE